MWEAIHPLSCISNGLSGCAETLRFAHTLFVILAHFRPEIGALIRQFPPPAAYSCRESASIGYWLKPAAVHDDRTRTACPWSIHVAKYSSAGTRPAGMENTSPRSLLSASIRPRFSRC